MDAKTSATVRTGAADGFAAAGASSVGASAPATSAAFATTRAGRPPIAASARCMRIAVALLNSADTTFDFTVVISVSNM